MTHPFVLFISHSAEVGGGELSLFDIIESGQYCEVLLFEDGPFGQKLREIGIEPKVSNAGSILDIRRDSGWRVALRLPSLIKFALPLCFRFRRFDVIYANSQKAFIVAALANIYSRRPLVWHLHDIMVSGHFSTIMKRAAILLANRSAKLVIVNSKATRDAYVAAGGLTPAIIVPNGIRPDSYLKAGAIRASLRLRLVRRLNINHSKILGMFGRLAEWKGQHIAVRALAKLPDCHLVFVGSALFGEEMYEQDLRRLADALGVSNRTHFLGFHSSVAELMAAVDVVLHCSIAPEPFGRVIVEAMMAGTPVIATAAGGPAEIVDHESTGLLIAPDDVRSLIVAVRRVIDEPEKAREMAEKARREALISYNFNHIVGIMNDTLLSLVPIN